MGWGKFVDGKMNGWEYRVSCSPITVERWWYCCSGSTTSINQLSLFTVDIAIKANEKQRRSERRGENR